MTQSQLNREVAQRTGENVSEISRRGFSIADPDFVCFDPEPTEYGQIVDWDAADAERNVAFA